MISFTTYCYGNPINDETDGSCDTDQRHERAYIQHFGRKAKQEHLEREGNVCDRIHLAKGMTQQQSVVSKVTILRVKNDREIVTGLPRVVMRFISLLQSV